MTMIHQDFETQSLSDLPITGTMRYVLDTSTRCLLWSWALDEDPVKLWCPDLSAELALEVWAYVEGRMATVGKCPEEVVEALKKPDTYIVGWNEAFDRHVWQQVATPDNNFPTIRIEQTLDSMSQAQASNLPGSLEFAGRALGLGQKTIGGKAVMKRFADRALPLPGASVTVDAAPDRARAIKDALEMWALYLDYSVQDTELMRSVWNVTRPLDATEWSEYWVSERINDRGMLADLDVCRGAVTYREEEAVHVAEECLRLTDGVIAKPTLTKQINEWVFDRLPDDLAESMVKDRDEEGYVTRLTGSKDVVTRLLEDINASDTPPADEVVEFLELMEFGRSSSAIKFEKVLNQQVDGRLSGSYVFNGAGQTGRFCVAPETLVDTSDGVRQIVSLAPGDKVISHRGNVCEVEALVYKGREQMYRIIGPNGAHVTATAAHRVFTKKGWARIDECFDISIGRPGILREGCEPLSFVGLHDGADRREAGGNTCDGQRSASRSVVGGRTSPVEGGQPFSKEDGGSEPDVRQEDRGRSDTAEGPGGGMERDRVHVRTSALGGQVARSGELAGALGSTPHRRGPDEQRLGQSSGGDAFGAPETAQEVAWSLVPVGEGEVWDISVAGDHSYIAQGIAHHNSSRGVQMHNLVNKFLPGELDILDMIAAQVPIERIREIGPVSSVLSKMIRPTFIAPPGKLLVWGDWSAIEARVTPWLAETRDADQAVLELFRRSDLGKEHPDVYVENAATVFRTSADVIWERYMNGDVEAKGMRQAGKVMVLSLGFLGGVGALLGMARNYGMRLSHEEAKLWVDGWRDRNRWAKRYGKKCEEAAFAAMRAPLTRRKAGRLTYEYLPDLMRGTLVCYLPDGRPLVYPMAKIAQVEKFGKMDWAITYLNGMGRRSLWNGLQVENGTQATAASILRSTLVRLETEETEAEIVLHTHDEAGGEVDEDKAFDFADRLEETMTRGFDWTPDLPLAAEVIVNYYYTKDEKAAMKRPS